MWFASRQVRTRTTYLKIRLSKRLVLVISARRFATNPVRRSQKIKQTVISWPIGSVREIALRFDRYTLRRLALDGLTGDGKLKWVEGLILTGVTGVIFFGWQLVNPKHINPPPVFAAAPQSSDFEYQAPDQTTGLPKSVPIAVKIAKIDLAYDVVKVGLMPDGTLQTPGLFDKTIGWYKFGVTPGQVGSAVMVGHVDNYQGPSVFWRLSELLPGDKIDIERQDGSTARFAVSVVKQYDQDNFPTKKIYGDVEHAGLRLITCGGVFEVSSGHYSQNTVVFAELVD